MTRNEFGFEVHAPRMRQSTTHTTDHHHTLLFVSRDAGHLPFAFIFTPSRRRSSTARGSRSPRRFLWIKLARFV